MGNPDLAPQALDGDIYAPPIEFDYKQTLFHLQTASPEISAAMTEVSRARFALERARVDPIPNVSLQALVNVVDNGIGGKADGHSRINANPSIQSKPGSNPEGTARGTACSRARPKLITFGQF